MRLHPARQAIWHRRSALAFFLLIVPPWIHTDTPRLPLDTHYFLAPNGARQLKLLRRFGVFKVTFADSLTAMIPMDSKMFGEGGEQELEMELELELENISLRFLLQLLIGSVWLKELLSSLLKINQIKLIKRKVMVKTEGTVT